MNHGILLTFSIIFASHFSTAQNATLASDLTGEELAYVEIPVFTDSELLDRLNKVKNSVIAPRLNSIVKSYIGTYTVRKRESTQNMLGKVDMYFPMFEKYLRESKMPVDLKYLPVLESALNPTAVSRSGAVGLWQFMPATGRENGLSINSLVDERKDPNKSTIAAIKYLKHLYNRYDDWSLALAAYNGGPGRVNRAIKRAHSKNFWRIDKYLPRETRNYVPAFIAAYYIVHYYEQHNMFPNYPEVDMQITETTTVYERISFQRISEITGTPMHIIEALNPSYKQLFIPGSTAGNFLILPQHRMGALLNQIGRPDTRLNRLAGGHVGAPGSQFISSENFEKAVYLAQGDENLETLACQFNCSVTDIKKWNYLNTDKLIRGQRIYFYTPKISAIDLLPVPLPESKIKAESTTTEERMLPERTYGSANIRTISRKYPFYAKDQKDGKYIYYQVKRRESLLDISRKFPEISLQELREINNIRDNSDLRSGSRIVVKVPQ